MFGVLATLIVGGLLALLRRPAQPGASPAEVSPVMLAMWEHSLSQMPKHSDLAQLFERLAVVERSVAELRGLVTGMRDMTSRTERSVQSLINHMTSKGAD